MLSSRNVLKVTLVLAFAIAGCAKYESKPLTPEAVEQALRPPDAPAIQVAASELHHPTLPPMALDMNAAISPDQAAILAVIINPDLRAERARRAIAAAQLLQAGILPNPELTGSLDFPYGSSPPDNFTAYSIGANWEVTSLITRDARVRAASAEAESVQLDVAWREWQIAAAAKTAAFDVVALQNEVQAATEIEQQLNENLRVIRSAVDQHDKSVLDLAAAEVAAQESQSTLLDQRRDLDRQRLVLNRSIGLPPETNLRLQSQGELPTRLEPPPAERLLADLETHRLDLVALRKGYESQDGALRVAILEQFPRINLGFNAARDTSDVKTVGIGVGIEIPLFDRQQGKIALETATRQKLFDEYASRIFAARADVASAIAEIHSANAQIAATSTALRGLETMVQTYKAAFDGGNADIVSFYSTQNTLVQKRLELARQKQLLIENWIALEIASGQYLPMAGPTTQEANP